MAESPEQTRRLEHWVHWSLLSGLAVSCLLTVAGLLLALAESRRGFVPSGSMVSSWAAVRHWAHSYRPAVLLDLGLLALIATPVIRVAVLGIGWASIRQWRFAAVALAVLVLLVLSLVLGLG